MNKIIILGTLLVLFVACSDKNKEIKPKIKEVPELNTTKEINSTKELNTSTATIMVIPEEFIPEHIRRSSIEVVPH